MVLRVIKRDGSLEDFEKGKIERVTKAAGLSQQQAKYLAEKIEKRLKYRLMAIESFSVPVGSNIIPFDLPATDGKNYSAESFKEAKALVVAFSCNHCPYAKAAWPLLIKLAGEFKDKGISFVAINPNDEKKNHRLENQLPLFKRRNSRGRKSL